MTLDAVSRPDEEYGERDMAWTRRFFSSLDRFHNSVYVDFLGAERSLTGFARRPRRRLRPAGNRESQEPADNVFHHDQNIRPRKMTARAVAT